jgi:hypothetical protein
MYSMFEIKFNLYLLFQGFIQHQNAYLRNAWNILDFTIVLIG